jgi:uncharacterized protein CbrC (UPF0167 family)
MHTTIIIEPIKLGKNNMVRTTMNVCGKTFKAYCTKGNYSYNEIEAEAKMFTQLWGQAAEELGAGFTDQFYDAAELIHELVGAADRSAIMAST